MLIGVLGGSIGCASLLAQSPAVAVAARPRHDASLDPALVAAVKAGDAARVKELVLQGADASACDPRGWPVSTLAACRGQMEVLHSLYARPPGPGPFHGPGGWDALQEAAGNGHLEVVRFLLAHGAASDVGTRYGSNAADYAEDRDYPEIAALLRGVPKPAEQPPDLDPDTPLTIAAAAGDADKLTALLDQGQPIEGRDHGGRTPLICAVIAGKTETVRRLLARHADPNLPAAQSQRSPLDFALGWKRDDIASLLLEAGADANGFRVVNQRGVSLSPLFIALEHGHAEVVRQLLAHGARPDDRNNQGETALLHAGRWNVADCLALLIEKGAKLDAQNQQGFTGLIFSCHNGREGNVRLLLAKGADVHVAGRNEGNNQPYGPLEAAEEGGNPFVLEALADAGATSARPKGKLADELVAAVSRGEFELAQAAIAKGAPLNDPDESDVLPLTVAICRGDPGLVRLLLRAGADVHSPLYGPDRSPPLALAQERLNKATDPKERQTFTEIVELLRPPRGER